MSKVTGKSNPQRVGKPPKDPLDIAAEMAFRAQLALVEESVHSQLHDHWHPCDDCGSYLQTAMSLASKLLSGYENAGRTGLLGAFEEIITLEEGEDETFLDYLSRDGVAKEIFDFVTILGWHDPLDDDDDDDGSEA